MRVDRLWYSDSAWPRTARALLSPLGWAYGQIMSARNAAYDGGWLATIPSQLPVLSVGNLTVGGTGKTPLAAYFVHRLSTRGARPAVVLRGYGDDEPRVHQRLNPEATTIVDANRVRAIETARRAGADVVVLDDGFQHRRVGRLEDCVVLSAEQFTGTRRAIPAGPWREGLGSLERATLVIVTRKAASVERAGEVARAVSSVAARVAIAGLALDMLQHEGLERALAIESFRHMRVLAVAGIGNPQAFGAQLRAIGMRVDLREYPDHHAYTRADAEAIATASRMYEAVVCTLKDAVKLTPLWPRTAPPLWYVSQRVTLEAGAAHVDASVESLLGARIQSNHSAGDAGL